MSDGARRAPAWPAGRGGRRPPERTPGEGIGPGRRAAAWVWSRARRGAAASLLAGFLAAATGCEDQIKWIPWFSTMTSQPSQEAYEVEPLPPPEGTMPVDGKRSYDLLAADTALTSPLAMSDSVIQAGQELFRVFCTPCHGETGDGDGPVVGQNRIPPTPLLDLLSERARGLSDGYVWGMITNGRGLMPSYRRIPHDERWLVVAYVRFLQRDAAGGAGGAGAVARDTASGAGGDTTSGAAGDKASGAAGSKTAGGGRR